MQAVILAGGKGVRLQSKLGGLPRGHGFRDILALLGYNPGAITDYFGNGRNFGVSLEYAIEESPLGSAGAVLAAFDRLEERFLVVYGDTMLNVDAGRFWRWHASKEADASLFVHPNDHPQDSDLVEMTESGRIQAFHPKPRAAGRYYSNLVNAALYVVEKRALETWRRVKPPVDFGGDLFPAMLRAGRNLFGYRSREYIKDVGTPASLEQVESDLSSGRVAAGSFSAPSRAVFLDRDGTINEEVNRLSDPAQFRLLPGVGAAIRKLNRAGYAVIVVTNQPVIARGDCTEETLRKIHDRMETELGEASAYLDGIYYCPHHPDGGFAGERPELKLACSCRKPEAGMIQAACAEMNLNPSGSWLIGDSDSDSGAARRAGIRFIRLLGGTTAPSETAGAPELHFPRLDRAVDFLLEHDAQK
jgi:histidinol-phosphate phosphatase family protein